MEKEIWKRAKRKTMLMHDDVVTKKLDRLLPVSPESSEQREGGCPRGGTLFGPVRHSFSSSDSGLLFGLPAPGSLPGPLNFRFPPPACTGPVCKAHTELKD